MTRIYPLEYRTAFLDEGRSKSYGSYGARVPQAKMLFFAKNNLQSQTLFDLERCGG